MEDKYNIEIKDIKPTDTIIIHFKQGCTIDEASAIYNIFVQTYPNNKVIWTYDELLYDIEVVEE